MECAVQHSTEAMYVGIELADKEWKLSFGDRQHARLRTIKARSLDRFLGEVRGAKAALGLSADVPVYSCYEAGRDGFWVDRFLAKSGISNVVVDPSSIEVNRRRRRAKTDRLDAGKLRQQLIRDRREDDRANWRTLRVPTRDAEDHRRIGRELERLKKERGQHIVRLKSLAALHGVKLTNARVDFGKLRDWEGRPLPPHLHGEMSRELQRLKLVDEQIREVNALRRQRLKEPTCHAEEVAVKLMQLRGIGMEGAWTLGSEFFGWRHFRNRREVGAAAGLTGTPYNTGNSERDQGISKSGNARVRKMIIELSWGWLRFQPDSKLSKWFNQRFAQGTKRMRRVGIVALARKLLIALWRYAEHDEVPEGAVLTPSC